MHVICGVSFMTNGITCKTNNKSSMGILKCTPRYNKVELVVLLNLRVSYQTNKNWGKFIMLPFIKNTHTYVPK